MPFLGKWVATRTAPEEVALQLVFSKCIPVLLFGLESMHLSDMMSLDFSFNRLLMKLFKTTNISIINDRRLYILWYKTVQ